MHAVESGDWDWNIAVAAIRPLAFQSLGAAQYWAQCQKMTRNSEQRELTIGRLLRPHAKAVTIGIIANIVEGAASLAEPWPLKVVLDTVLRSSPDFSRVL